MRQSWSGGATLGIRPEFERGTPRLALAQFFWWWVNKCCWKTGCEVSPADLESRHKWPIPALAQILFEKMEHLDPGFCGGSRWDELTPENQEFYALCVESIIERSSLVRIALADNDMIFRHPHAAE
jgi:hypothetical protein